jgi:2-polyprenyl-3-methyl-5-hydroxy-6-metoxy-1,4-benzoquinol methylase
MNEAVTALAGQLERDLSAYPAIARVFGEVLAIWPEHQRYIAKSFAGRADAVWDTTEALAQAALVLVGDRLPQIVENYRWTCDRLREEELHFHRTGEYRLKTFAEADAEVYANAAYMEQYVDGLLMSQLLWFNHAASCEFFLSTAPRLLPAGARMLEIGPGHGLMTYLALRDFQLGSAVAWDISPVSIEQTRHALAKLGREDVEFGVRDLMAVRPGEDLFDFVVLSEVLEHVEDPKQALRQVRGLLRDDGLLFVNVPINSPSPDHLYLMKSVEDARALLEDTGFAIVDQGVFPSQGLSLEKALRNQATVSICLFGRKS